MRPLTIIVLCISSLIVTAQITFEKVVKRAGAEYLSSVIQTADGGFAAMGECTGGNDKWLVRTDAMGDTLWTRVYPGIGNNQQGDRYFAETSEGGFTFLSYLPYKATLAHVDATGQPVWEKELFPGLGYALFPTSGGYLIAGQGSDSAYMSNLTICKVTLNGDLTWKRTYLTVPLGHMLSIHPQAIRETRQGEYIVAGNFYSGFFMNTPFLFRISPSGDSLWCKQYRRSGDDAIYSVDTTADGGFIACGWINSNSTAYAIKVDNAGDTLWTNANFLLSGDQFFNSVLSTTDGGAVVCGQTSNTDFGPDTNKVYLVKFSTSGSIEWERKIGTLGSSSGICIDRTSDHGYVICGYVNPYDTSYRGGGLLIKTDANGNFAGTKESEKLSDYKVFPNPAFDHITFSFPIRMISSRTITFYDLFGKEVYIKQVPQGQTRVTVETGSWRPGLFLYVISDGSRNITGKICILGNRH